MTNEPTEEQLERWEREAAPVGGGPGSFYYRLACIAYTAGMNHADDELALWRTLASPQTALMLGSDLDPNDTGVDWHRECLSLLRSRIHGST